MPSFPRWLASLVVVLVCGSSLLAQGSEPFVPARLAPPSGDGSMLLARGLWCARQGDLTRSLELAKLARDAAPGDERVQRGAQRLESLHTTRTEWVAGLLEGRGKLFLVRGGKRAALKLRSLEGGLLVFSKNSLGLESAPLDGLPIAELFDLARGLPAEAPDWVVPYARCLGGLEGWSKGLDEKDPEHAALLGDVEDLGRLLALGEVGEALARLAATPLDQDGLPTAEDAAEALPLIEAVARGADGLKVVQERTGDLRALARACLTADVRSNPERLPLAGEASWGSGGRLTLTYSFDDESDASDFVLRNDYLHEWHATMSPVDKAPEDSYFIVKQGAFFGDGQLVYRHRLEFGPGVRVGYEMRYIQREGDTIDVGVVMIGLADDGKGSFASASEFGDTYAIDLESFHNQRKLYEGERLVEINTIYAAEARLESDDELGAVVEAWRDGEKRGELGTGGRDTGGVFLYVHSPRIVAIESMVIEGVPDPASLEALRTSWVDERLTALGFD